MSSHKMPLRTNVLVLMLAGYLTVLLIFILLVFGSDEVDVTMAYDIVKGPLMALVGGSLAISKDLIPYKDNSKDTPGQPKDEGVKPDVG